MVLSSNWRSAVGDALTNQFWLLPNGAPQPPLVEDGFEQMRRSGSSLVTE
jgi:hypothetical protein